MSDAVGTVGSLSRFPVKSMLGEDLDEAEFIDRGIVGDRAYALIDTESGKVASAKNPRLWGDLLACRAEFVEPPTGGGAPTPVRITFPDGSAVASDASDVDAALSAFAGRSVTLSRTAPDDFTIDQYHPDLANLSPEGHRDALVDQKLGTTFFAEAGLPAAVAPGSFFDLFPISVMTTSTLDHLSELAPTTRFDPRRFRMNAILSTTEAGFIENEWLGKEVSLGDGVRIVVLIPDPRCVMTTLAQGDLPKDNGVLRTLVDHNRQTVGEGQHPCAGVYAVVAASGTVRIGDAVTVA